MFVTLVNEIAVMGSECQKSTQVSADLQVKLIEKHEQLLPYKKALNSKREQYDAFHQEDSKETELKKS